MQGWSTACLDWEARIIAGRSLIPDGLPIDRARAEKALRIFKRLKVKDIIGKPTLGEVCPQWIFDLVWVVFGAHDSAAKRQLIREFLVLISKKNAKSTIAAGIMVTALIMNQRAMGEYLILAPTKDVADNSFLPAHGMITEDNALFKRFKPSDTTREIINRLDDSVLAVKSADADVVGGQKAICSFIDELWLFGKKASSANVLSEVTGSQASRPEGFTIYATTQSDDPPTGVFAQKLLYHRGVRDGKIEDPTSLPLIYEYPPQMAKDQAWRDPKTWHIPNPSIGHSVDVQWLTTELRKKELEGTASLSLFVSKHFNIEAGLGLKSGSWAGAEFWLGNPKTGASNVDRTLTLKEVIRRSDVIVIGIDGGGLDDLLGLAVLGREEPTGKLLLWSHAWAHEIVKERRTDIASKLEELSDLGELTFVDLPGEDVEQLAEIVFEIEASGKLAAENSIGVDSFGVAAITKALTGEESPIEKDRIVGISQGWKLNGAIKDTERDLAGGVIEHDGGALMRFAVGNAKVVPRGNAISIDKQESGSAKIDPLMAALHAKVLMGLNPEAAGTAEILAI
ncbi:MULTISPECIES: terminase large subunit [unclassified Mesorhizobium]|uniref:terminase large subunit n=1 Tax=unclassified Mesorhizobium TaxID=325217 RepID=UPI000FCB5A84|nr:MULTISPECIES: terminase large subunit [unclassified Mesorhizobium]TGP22306.1 terminase large subunit [Mesorhizobium sp. M1D.F.Ca.ET.231.01.1.1]TGP24724.1 terminase large subunit [Mesorhizobium sp. M1D.F.Ca.ET.234.01.1.1]TGS37327.1 terminase large subunit [Mesorhizobium sp. M1D.F.Ca.ET.184.01.1.1]TGS58127.1 terminase large subunit [Mesorhizobium sp. M1D.F.Ca.ET.183.01.1.1]